MLGGTLFAIVCLLVAVSLLGKSTSADSSQNGAYPAMFERDFMTGCTNSGGTTSQCRCTLDTVESMYAKEEIVSLTLEVQRTGAYPPELTAAIQSRCS